MDENQSNWGVEAVKASLSSKGLISRLPVMRSTGFDEAISLVTAEHGKVVIDWYADPKFDSFDGIIQGGMQIAITDMAQGMCFMSLHNGPKGFSTVDLSTRFLRHVHTDQTYQIISEVVDETRNTAIIESRIVGSDGKTRTYFTGSWKVHERAFNVK